MIEVIEEIIRAGKILRESGLVVAGSGNLSAKWSDLILITRSGAKLGDLTLDDITIMDLEGRRLLGREQSMEWRMHLFVYRERDDVRAVVHAHPPNAIIISKRIEILEPSSLEGSLFLGEVPVLGELEPGSEDLAREVARKVSEGYDAVILRGHGAVTVGGSMEEAISRMEILEKEAFLGRGNL